MTEAGFKDLLQEAHEAEQRGDLNAAYRMLELAMAKSNESGPPTLGLMLRLCVLRGRLGVVRAPSVN